MQLALDYPLSSFHFSVTFSFCKTNITRPVQLLRHSIVSVPIGFISEALGDHVELSAMKCYNKQFYVASV